MGYMRPDPREFLSAIGTFLDYDADVIGFDDASADQFGRQPLFLTVLPVQGLKKIAATGSNECMPACPAAAPPD